MTVSSDNRPQSEGRRHGDTTTPAATTAPGKFDVHKVAIIGAGPSGLAAAKYLLAECGGGVFTQVDIFEQRTEVGGVWKHTPWYSPPPTAASSGTKTGTPLQDGGAVVVREVPQTNALVDVDEPVFLPVHDERGGGGGGGDENTRTAGPIFPSPMYDELNTNIPHTLMQFSDLPFPAGCEIYPTRQVVQEYLVEYAQDVRHLIRFATQVVDVSLVDPSSSSSLSFKDKWKVTTRNLLDNHITTAVYDAVVVASGHYATSYIPDVPGIREFQATWPDVISHSKSYRAPGDPSYDCTPAGARKVVVVGNSASGLDIASQIRRARAEGSGTAAAAAAPVISSVQTATPDDMRRFIEEDQGFAYDEAPPISRFLAEQKGVEFADGRVELGVDRVLFATGYLYTFPFLKSLTTAPALDGDGAGTDISNTSNTIGPLITTGARVHNLAKHLLHIAHPTLVFPGLPIKVIPFPFAEAQAAVFARLWSNRLELPPRNVLDAWEREPAEVAAEKHTSRGAELVDAETRARKAERGYHIFGTGEDGRYINEMNEWVTTGRWPGSSGPSAEGQIDGAPGGSKNETKTRPGGKQPPFWDERMLWQRTIFAQARVAFEKGGRRAKTLEELGFVFEDRDKAAAGASAAQVGTSKDGVQKKQDVPNGDTADAEAFAAP